MFSDQHKMPVTFGFAICVMLLIVSLLKAIFTLLLAVGFITVSLGQHASDDVAPSKDANQTIKTENTEDAAKRVSKDVAAGDLAPTDLSAIVTISDGRGSGGTGFICNVGGKHYLITNQHVIAGLRNARFQTHGGHVLSPCALQIATGADLAMLELPALPVGVNPLELLDGLASKAAATDAVTIPGNSNADDVVTQTHGKLLAVGGAKIETDCPIFAGNSGSPIIHRKTMKVIGVLTEVRLLRLDPFDKVSFRSKKSALKSELRYFGYRIDTVASWKPATLSALNREAQTIDQSNQELEWIGQYFTGSSDGYKQFKELHAARNEVSKAFGRRDLALSEKERHQRRFLWRLEGLIGKAAERVPKRVLVYCHEKKASNIIELAAFLKGGVEIVRRDDEVTVELIKRGY